MPKPAAWLKPASIHLFFFLNNNDSTASKWQRMKKMDPVYLCISSHMFCISHTHTNIYVYSSTGIKTTCIKKSNFCSNPEHLSDTQIPKPLSILTFSLSALKCLALFVPFLHGLISTKPQPSCVKAQIRLWTAGVNRQEGVKECVCVSVCEREGEKDPDPVYKHPSPVMSPLGRNEK